MGLCFTSPIFDIFLLLLIHSHLSFTLYRLQSDFGSEIESDDEENDVWATPPETRSRMSPFLETSARDDDKQHKIFIFG